MQRTAVVTDPQNSMKVRFTDNSAKDGDKYNENQIKQPLLLDPMDIPYMYTYIEGDGDSCDDGC